ncbi:MAG: response regulator [Myxococcota bacterium]
MSTGVPARPRILLIDDERDLLEVLAAEMEEAGYDVTCVGSGAEALECARTQQFDLILTDFKMPGMDGLQTVAALAEQNPALHAILMTGFISDEMRYALKQRCYPCLEKPFRLEDLLQTLAGELRMPAPNRHSPH